LPGQPVVESTVPPQYVAPLWIYIASAALGVVLIGEAYTANYNSWWPMVGLIAWFSSHGLSILFRVWSGPLTLREAFDPHTQSWSVLADAALAFSIGAASYGWRYLGDGWFRSWWWPIVAVLPVLGLIIARFVKFDRPNYVKDGAAVLLSDPWKVMHDFTSTMALGGLLFMLCLPVLASGVLWHHPVVPALVLAGIMVWFATLPHELHLDVWNLHTVFNWKTKRYEPNYPH
jgi:hypothetical protein